jgi:DNA-binding NarL/FixJ family response regulator
MAAGAATVCGQRVMIRVMLVDDQQMMRAGLRMVIEAEDDMQVIAEAATGGEALALFAGARPDVVLMDVQMPGMDGLTATKQLVSGEDRSANAKIVILTTFDRDDYLFEALAVGASGFLLKNAPPEELVAAIRIVASGEALLAPAVTRRVIAAAAQHRPSAVAVASPLTDREADVLRLMARGLSNSEIAAELYVGEATIKTHVSNVLLKLGVRDRVQAVVWAFEQGFVRAM